MSIVNGFRNTVKYMLKPAMMSAAMLICGTGQAGLLGGLLNNLNVDADIGTVGADVQVTGTIASVGMDFTAWVTMLDPTGRPVNNPSFSDEPNYHGRRYPITGKMVFNLTADGLVGAASFEPFDFFGVPASGREITFVPAHTILGLVPVDTLLLANMLFDWNNNIGIPVSLVLDIGDLTTTLMNTSEGDVLKGLLTAETDNTTVRGGDDFTLGPVLVATTSWDTTDVDTDGDGVPGPLSQGDNPSGTTPLLQDMVIDATNGDIGIGGSPMKAGPFIGFSANLDVVEATVTCVSALLSDCETGGLKVPQIPLSAEPLEPLLNLLHL